jgi:uncharacterized protein (DUF58 family)
MGEVSRDLLRQIRKIEIVTRRLVDQQMAGQDHSVFKGRGMSFDEVRAYAPGDEPRFIDWNVTARTGTPHVKRFVEERELTVLLVVDMSGSMSFGTTRAEKREAAAMLAALMGFSAISNGDRVGLVAFTDEVEVFVPPKKGRKHVLRIIDEVLSLEPKRRGTRLSAALEFVGQVTKRKSVVVLISDFLDDGYERAMQIAARRHDLIPLSVSDPAEEALPDLGLVLLEDTEGGGLMALDAGASVVRDAWGASVQARLGARDRIARATGARAGAEPHRRGRALPRLGCAEGRAGGGGPQHRARGE